jgi:hypothetical protein
VHIITTVKVTNKKLSEVDRILNNIDMKFTNTPYYLTASTQFKNSRGAWQESLSDFANSILSSGNKFEITSVIMMPSKNSLTISNKYGNVFIADHSAPLKITISNGDLKAMNLTGETSLDLSFCNATISSVTQAKMSLGYSEVTLKKANKITLDSRSSKLWITKIGNLELISKRDKINIDTVGTMSGQSDFSSFHLGTVLENISMKTFYGEMNVSNAGTIFKYIQLNSEYTDISLGFPQAAPFSFTSDYKRTTVIVPPTYTNLKKEMLNEKDQIYKMNGFVNAETQPAASVQINALSGTITLISK